MYMYRSAPLICGEAQKLSSRWETPCSERGSRLTYLGTAVYQRRLGASAPVDRGLDRSSMWSRSAPRLDRSYTGSGGGARMGEWARGSKERVGIKPMVRKLRCYLRTAPLTLGVNVTCTRPEKKGLVQWPTVHCTDTHVT